MHAEPLDALGEQASVIGEFFFFFFFFFFFCSRTKFAVVPTPLTVTRRQLSEEGVVLKAAGGTGTVTGGKGFAARLLWPFGSRSKI